MRERDRGTEGQRDNMTEGQRDRGRAGQRDSGTAGQKDRGTAGQRDRLLSFSLVAPVLLLQETLSSCFCFAYSFIFKRFYSNRANNETKLSELIFTTSD